MAHQAGLIGGEGYANPNFYFILKLTRVHWMVLKLFICAQLEPARINAEEMLHNFNAQMLLICLK